MEIRIVSEKLFLDNSRIPSVIRNSFDIVTKRPQYTYLVYNRKKNHDPSVIDNQIKDYYNRTLESLGQDENSENLEMKLDIEYLNFKILDTKIIEIQIIQRLNEYFGKKFNLIEFPLTKYPKIDFYSRFSKFIHENIIFLTKQILHYIVNIDKRYKFLDFKEKIKSVPEIREELTFKFQLIAINCPEFENLIEINFNENTFYARAEFEYKGKNIHTNLKKMSKILEYLKIVAESAKLVKNFKKLDFRLKSFRLQPDSYQIFREISDIFNYYSKNIVEIEESINLIMKYDDLKTANEQKKIMEIIKNSSETIKSSMINEINSSLPRNELETIYEKFHFFKMIMHLAHELFALGITLKKSSTLFNNFCLIKPLSQAEIWVSAFGGKCLSINLLNCYKVVYNKPLFNTDLTLSNKCTDEEIYFDSLKEFLTEFLGLPTLEEFYDEEKSLLYILLEIPKELAEKRFFLSSQRRSNQVIKYIEKIENEATCYLLMKNSYTPLTETLHHIDKKTTPKFILNIFEAIFNLHSESAPFIHCLDPSCFYISKTNKVKILLKAPEEIEDEYKAPEINSNPFPGRVCSKSLIFSFGQVIDTIYFKQIKGFSVKQENIFHLTKPENSLKQLIKDSTNKNLNIRPSFSELFRKLTQIIK